MQIVRRSFFDLTAMAAAAAPLARELHAAEAGLAELRGDAPGLVEALAPQAHADLDHPLSACFAGARAASLHRDRRAHEGGMVAVFDGLLPHARSASDFRSALGAANALVAPPGELRRNEVGLPRTCGALQVLFPEPAGLAHRLDEIHAFVSGQPRSAVVAMVALAAILNAHPFVDGNGRLARALYAHLLGTMGLSGYFPFAAVIHNSRGAFELCLREGEVRQNWHPFLRYNARILVLAARHCCPALQE